MIIPAPCEADWDSMIGNERVRFCEHCHLRVTNLSALTRQEAMRLVARSEGRLCVRFVKRLDGRVVTKQLPLKLHQIGRRVSRIAAGAFTATLSLSAAAAQTRPEADRILGIPRAAVALSAATSEAESTVTGTVTDPNGAVVAGASVTLLNNRTGANFVYVTNDDGSYTFSLLEVGDYTLNAEAPNFAKAQSVELRLTAGSKRTVDISLEIPEVVEEVQVVSEERELTVIMGGGAIREPDDPLARAAFKNDLAALVELIPTTADINASDKATDANALAYAIENNNRDMVQVLISAGAMPNAKNSKGETPMMFLSPEASAQFVRELIAIGADAKANDDSGRSVLMNAARFCNFAVVKELIEAGARTDARDNAGNTVLMSAAENEDRDVIKLLIKQGVPLDHKNEDGESAVIIAVRSGRGENLKVLIDAGASMSFGKEDLAIALVIATRNGDLTTARILLDRGADPNAKDDDTTVLMLAAENGNPALVKAVIDAGAELDAVDDSGWTAMMHADEVENVRTLLNAGANMAVKNNDGETALAMAIKYDQTEIVQLLKSRGAPE
jgi:ankyrin repeat protein